MTLDECFKKYEPEQEIYQTSNPCVSYTIQFIREVKEVLNDALLSTPHLREIYAPACAAKDWELYEGENNDS